MNDREQLILKAIIKHYLEFGESVGSRTLEKKYNIGVSSATIRNTMADLEDKGLIAKTHTSSGRIPTSEGYKLYVEELIKIRDISKEAKAKVVEAYNKKMNQIDMIFEETSRLLSKISKYAGVVLEPAIRQEGIRKVQLVHINDTNIMAVIIMDSFLTKNLNIFLENPVDEEEVQNINMILNDEINRSPNFTLSDLEKFLTNTDLFVPEDFQKNKMLNEGKLFFEGGSNLIESNTSDVMKIIDRVKFFNNPEDMKQIFLQFIQTNQFKDGEVNVIFGEDLDIAGLEDFSFVHEPEKAKGRIHNSSLWNELKNVKNVNLEISEDWRYSGKGNVHDIYIKNEHENTVYHSENDNDYSYEERKKPSFKEITEIIYRNYNNVPDFTIEMDSKGSLWFNDDTMKEVIENKSLNSKESIDNFISELRYRMPMTQLSGKATALMKNSLIKAIEQTQKKQETKNTKQIR